MEPNQILKFSTTECIQYVHNVTLAYDVMVWVLVMELHPPDPSPKAVSNMASIGRRYSKV